jgi:hypothetical protein
VGNGRNCDEAGECPRGSRFHPLRVPPWAMDREGDEAGSPHGIRQLVALAATTFLAACEARAGVERHDGELFPGSCQSSPAPRFRFCASLGRSELSIRTVPRARNGRNCDEVEECPRG